MQGALSSSRRRALGLALILCAPCAGALQIGEIEVRSAIGEPLDARVPLSLSAGEYVEGSCFSLLREAAAGVGLPALAEGILSVHTAPGGAKTLRIRSGSRMQEPALMMRVRAACTGQEAQAVRDFIVLLDPPRLAPRAPDALAAPTPTPRRAPRTASAAAPPVRPPPPRVAAAPGSREAASKRPTAEALAASAPVAASAPASAPAPVSTPAPVSARSQFVLKLSSPDVDLSRSRGIDDKMRARLRERQLVLDADDQVSALLALRHSVRQLEGRVAELQLKLTTLPQSLESRGASAAAGPAKAPPPTAAVRIESPIVTKSEPAPAPAKLADAPKVVAAPPEPPKVAAVAPEPKAVPATAAPPAAAAPTAPRAAPAAEPVKGAATPPAAVKVAKSPASPAPWLEGIPDYWLYALLAGVLLLLSGIVVWLLRRRAAARDEPAQQPQALARAEPAFDRHGALASPRTQAAPPAAGVPATASAPERAIASDAGLSTRLPEDSRELRRRYIEERFPEIANRTLRLEDPSSVVKAARLYYADGAFTRAVELLQFCIEDNPAQVRFWLALFEIFRLERLAAEYAALAERFKAHHGSTDSWRKVQYFGREIDPGNPLYKEEPLSTLETIGPSQARRLAKAGGAVDPIAENWLEAPMDFENEVLANELRRKLMAQAGLTEQDLAPSTLPVLRNVEMFQVA